MNEAGHHSSKSERSNALAYLTEERLLTPIWRSHLHTFLKTLDRVSGDIIRSIQAETSTSYSNPSILCFGQSAWSLTGMLYTSKKSPLLAF